MALYCIADTHLSQSVPKPMDVFGHRWAGYTEKLIRGWNAVVGEDDTVILPGDISWGLSLEEAAADLRLIHSLNGKKIIGKGNHDLWWQSEKKLKEFFAANDIDSISLLHNNAYHLEGKRICGSRGWYYDPKSSPEGADPEKIAAREVIRTELSIKAAFALPEGQEDELIAFFHFPPVYRDFVCRGIVDLLKQYGITRCYYGHIHGVYDLPASFDFEGITMTMVAADYLHFTPLLVR
ncbi:MAG: metallophosphoesterase [Clostridia bacterium]|nr:metallophosphoesterase [Clostridia bacterium]